MKKVVLVGIAGASGSGKTYLAEKLIEEFGSARAAVIGEDSYYKDQAGVPLAERACINYDHPDALDHERLAGDLQRLMNGEPIDEPVYDYATHSRLIETRKVAPRELIVVEGILILHSAPLREMMDVRIFVDTPLDVCFTRRMERDVAQRGRSAESVTQQYRQTVEPMYYEFVEPTKGFADVVIAGDEGNGGAVEDLIAQIMGKIEGVAENG